VIYAIRGRLASAYACFAAGPGVKHCSDIAAIVGDNLIWLYIRTAAIISTELTCYSITVVDVCRSVSYSEINVAVHVYLIIYQLVCFLQRYAY